MERWLSAARGRINWSSCDLSLSLSFFFRFLFIGYLLDGDGDTKWRGEMKNVGNFMREISLPRL